MGRILNSITNYVDKKVSSISKVEDPKVLESEIMEVSSIVKNSSMAILLSPRFIYKEYIKGVTQYYFDFIKKWKNQIFPKT